MYNIIDLIMSILIQWNDENAIQETTSGMVKKNIRIEGKIIKYDAVARSF